MQDVINISNISIQELLNICKNKYNFINYFKFKNNYVVVDYDY